MTVFVYKKEKKNTSGKLSILTKFNSKISSIVLNFGSKMEKNNTGVSSAFEAHFIQKVEESTAYLSNVGQILKQQKSQGLSPAFLCTLNCHKG